MRARSGRELFGIFTQIDRTLYAGQARASGVGVRWRKLPCDGQSFLFGQYDHERKLIDVNVRLSEPDCPKCVVWSIVHHELLHWLLGPKHDAKFASQERGLDPNWTQSDAWMDRLVLNLGRPGVVL